MYQLLRKRHVAGNICLVVFTAFILSLFVNLGGPLGGGGAEAAISVVPDSTPGAGETYIENILQPMTPLEFDNLINQLLNKLTGTYVNKIVYNTIYRGVYAEEKFVENVVYLVYVVPPGISPAYLPVSIVYHDVYNASRTFVAKVPKPPPEGGGGGGAAPPPTPPAQETPTGTAVVDTTAGTATLAVDETKVTAILQDPAQDRLVLVIPTGTGIKEHAVQIPATVLALAVETGKPIVIQAPTGQITIPPQALDVPALQELLATGEKVWVTVSIKEAPEATKGNVALALARPENKGLNLVGPVLDLSVTAKVEGKEPVQITSFNKALKLRLPYNEAGLKGVPEAYLGVYRISGTTLTYVGGRVLAAENAVEVELPSLSSYALMTYRVTFADTVGHWARQEIELMAAKHIVRGIGADRFAPDTTVTRAEFATLIVNALGVAGAKPAAGRFKDVAPGAWYFGTVEAAAEAGLLKGYPDGTFRPGQKITRQEMAALIVNTLKFCGKDVSIDRQEVQQLLGSYTDAPSIGGWAAEAVAVAVREGIIKGRTATTIVPLAGATRAEATVLMKQVLSNLNRI